VPLSVERLFSYARLRRLAEEVGVLSVDKTPDGVALKFSEKARISPEKLGSFVSSHESSLFTPAGVLRFKLSDEEQDNVLDVARDVLLELRTSD
jgi:transcription-repair coupling factor (superfamily II helicase)